MVQRPAWATYSCAAIQKIHRLISNPKVHYRFHKSPPMDPILSRMNTVNIYPQYISKIHFNIILPPTRDM
jgi:hypothetical protein